LRRLKITPVNSHFPAMTPPLGLRLGEARQDMMKTELTGLRGRDARCRAPPAQIRTSGIPAYGSYLG
jgi:hypothetical protein